MTRRIFATLAVVVAVSVSLAAAQGRASQAESTQTMSAIGIVTSVSGESLVIKVSRTTSMTFALDSATRVLKRGTGAKVRPAIFVPGQAIKVTDVLHQGDLVMVMYRKTGATLLASEIRVAGR